MRYLIDPHNITDFDRSDEEPRNLPIFFSLLHP
jgi:hypothetical protein